MHLVNLCYKTSELERESCADQRLAHILVCPALTAEDTGDGMATIRINDVMPMHVARAIALLVARYGEPAGQDQQARCDADHRWSSSRSGRMRADRPPRK